MDDMKTIELSQLELKDLCREESNEYLELFESDDWTQDYKYQFCNMVFKHIKTGRFYLISISRSGSYHSDWYYSYEDAGGVLVEVKKVEVVTTKWEAV